MTLEEMQADGRTFVTTHGEVLSEGPKGLVIMDWQNQLIIMEIDEISDSEICNIFIKTFHQIIPSIQMEEPENFPGPPSATHEILIPRKGEDMVFRLT